MSKSRRRLKTGTRKRKTTFILVEIMTVGREKNGAVICENEPSKVCPIPRFRVQPPRAGLLLPADLGDEHRRGAEDAALVARQEDHLANYHLAKFWKNDDAILCTALQSQIFVKICQNFH